VVVIAVLRMALGATIGCLGIYIGALNWCVVILQATRRRAPSWVPLFGGALMTLGLLLVSQSWFHRGWWLPWLLDGGAVPGFAWTAAALVARRARTPR
jgi:hypothetical protein